MIADSNKWRWRGSRHRKSFTVMSLFLGVQWHTNHHQHPVLWTPMCSTWLYLFGYVLQLMKRYVYCNYFINLMFSDDFPYQFASLRAYKMPFPRVILSQVLSPSCCKRSSSSSNALVNVTFCWSTVGWRVSSCHASSWFQLPVKACKIHQGKKIPGKKKGLWLSTTIEIQHLDSKKTERRFH